MKIMPLKRSAAKLSRGPMLSTVPMPRNAPAVIPRLNEITGGGLPKGRPTLLPESEAVL